MSSPRAGRSRPPPPGTSQTLVRPAGGQHRAALRCRRSHVCPAALGSQETDLLVIEWAINDPPTELTCKENREGGVALARAQGAGAHTRLCGVHGAACVRAQISAHPALPQPASPPSSLT